MASMPGWQAALLARLGAPVAPTNIRFLNAWQQAEGGTAAYNPLNTTQPFQGASNYNSVGVRNYPSSQAGVAATAQTLLNGRYSPIVQGLREAEDPTALARAVASSPWGTGPGVLKVLGASGAAQPLVRGATTAPASPAATVPNPGLDPSKLSALQNIHDLLGLPMPAGLAQALGQNGQTQQPKMAMPSTGNKAVDAVQSAKEYIGTPYSWGGGGPGGPSKGIGRGASTKGFDCSALLQYAWAKQGVHIPRTTYEQYKTGVPVAQQNLQPGDAIFFRGSDAKDGLPGHVGMYLGNGKFIEAPHTGATVRISDLSSRSDYVGARRYG